MKIETNWRKQICFPYAVYVSFWATYVRTVINGNIFHAHLRLRRACWSGLSVSTNRAGRNSSACHAWFTVRIWKSRIDVSFTRDFNVSWNFNVSAIFQPFTSLVQPPYCVQPAARLFWNYLNAGKMFFTVNQLLAESAVNRPVVTYLEYLGHQLGRFMMLLLLAARAPNYGT